MDMAKEEARYSNRQIERMLDDQKTSFDKQLDKQSVDIKDHIDRGLDPILTQVKKTNGRVSKHDRQILVIIVVISALVVSSPDLFKLILSAL